MPPRQRLRSSSRLRGEEPEYDGIEDIQQNRIRRTRGDSPEKQNTEAPAVEAPVIVPPQRTGRSGRSSRQRMVYVAPELASELELDSGKPEALLLDPFYREPSPYRNINSARRAKNDIYNFNISETPLNTHDFSIKTDTSTALKESKAPTDYSLFAKMSVLTSYFVVSIAIVFLNKILLSRQDIDNPLFVTWFQLVVSSLLTFIIPPLLGLFFSKESSVVQYFPTLTFSLPEALHILPISIIFSLLLVLNNACLLYVHISFYQIARSWTILFSMLTSRILYGTKVSKYVLFTSVIVVIGYMLACRGEMTLEEFATSFTSVFENCIYPSVYKVTSFIRSVFGPYAVHYSLTDIAHGIDYVCSFALSSIFSQETSNYVFSFIQSWTSLLSITDSFINSCAYKVFETLPGVMQHGLLALYASPKYELILKTDSPCDVPPIILGLFFGAISSLVLSIHSILIKRIQKSTGVHPTQFSGYLNILSSILLFVYMVGSGDWNNMMTGTAIHSTYFWTVLAIVSVVGYALSILNVQQIKMFSALTHNIVGTLKATVQSILGWYIYQNPVSSLTAFGSFLSIAGCGLYAHASQLSNKQQTEMLNQSKQPSVKEIQKQPTFRDEELVTAVNRRAGRGRSESRSRFSFPTTSSALPSRSGTPRRSLIGSSPVAPLRPLSGSPNIPIVEATFNISPSVVSWRSQFQKEARIASQRKAEKLQKLSISSNVQADGGEKSVKNNDEAQVIPRLSDGSLPYPDWSLSIGKFMYQFLTHPPTVDEK